MAGCDIASVEVRVRLPDSAPSNEVIKIHREDVWDELFGLLNDEEADRLEEEVKKMRLEEEVKKMHR